MKFLSLVLASLLATSTFAAPPAEMQAKIDAKLPELQAIANDATVIEAVKSANATPIAEGVGMTNDKWKELTIMSPEVKAFSKSKLATFLKSKKPAYVTEIFVNAEDGSKVAFLAKTSSWTHKGKAKHDKPMTGKTWVGDIEVDDSTGKQQIQIALPIFDGKKAIGSIVIGISVAELK